jgi:hypothetical protein
MGAWAELAVLLGIIDVTGDEVRAAMLPTVPLTFNLHSVECNEPRGEKLAARAVKLRHQTHC